MELTAHSGYSEVNYPIAYWKTASGFEVDFVLGDHEIAIEVKGTDMVTNKHMKGIRAFKEEYQCAQLHCGVHGHQSQTNGRWYRNPSVAGFSGSSVG